MESNRHGDARETSLHGSAVTLKCCRRSPFKSGILTVALTVALTIMIYLV